jgi:hypothetical protein
VLLPLPLVTLGQQYPTSPPVADFTKGLAKQKCVDDGQLSVLVDAAAFSFSSPLLVFSHTLTLAPSFNGSPLGHLMAALQRPFSTVKPERQVHFPL